MRRIAAIAVALILASGVVLRASGARFNLPGVDQGYSPPQPIAFSHRLHCGELEMRCLYCHAGAEKSRHAGVPAASVCMNCHRYVTASPGRRRAAESSAQAGRGPLEAVAPELEKLYSAVGFDARAGTQDGAGAGHPIEWVKVHDLPDFVAFDHRRHVNAGVTCRRCHGAVEEMDRITQVTDLGMGWCLGCHRDVDAGRIPELQGRSASTDCGACHY